MLGDKLLDCILARLRGFGEVHGLMVRSEQEEFLFIGDAVCYVNHSGCLSMSSSS